MAATIERNPNDGDAYMMRSHIYRQMGNLEQARSDSIMAASLGSR